MNPIVSIITCSLATNLIERTFVSIQKQCFSDWEWILVTPEKDKEVERIKNEFEYSEKIKVVLDDKQGIYAAMNLGARSSGGQYLVFLNEGDEFHDSQGLYNLIEAVKGKDWAFGGMLKVSSLYDKQKFYKFRPYSRTLHRFGWKYVPHPSSIVSRKAFEAVGGFNIRERIAADQELFLRASQISKPGISKEVISQFHLGGSSSRSVSSAMKDAKRISNTVFGPILGIKFVDDILWNLNVSLKSILKRMSS